MISIAKFINRTGEKNTNNFGSKMIITEYKSSKDINVYFPEYKYTAYNVQYGQFKDGRLSCPFEKRTYSVGYIGVGPHKTKENGKKTKEYEIWNHMLQRCYDEKHYIKQPTYIGCTVCDEWLCFQNFAEWYKNNYYEIPGQRMAIDKDILIKGNKVYSPDTCVIVPQCINSLFLKHEATRGEYPIGIYKNSKNRLVVQCNIYENKKIKRKYLGSFGQDQLSEAFYLYKTTKEANIKIIADEYKDKIPQELYDAMYNYIVESDD